MKLTNHDWSKIHKAIIGRNYAKLIGAFFVRPWGIAVFIKTIAK
jgi:hypothetical protein